MEEKRGERKEGRGEKRSKNLKNSIEMCNNYIFIIKSIIEMINFCYLNFILIN